MEGKGQLVEIRVGILESDRGLKNDREFIGSSFYALVRMMLGLRSSYIFKVVYT